MNNIIGNDSSTEFTNYETNRIASFYKDFGNPDLALKIYDFKHTASKDILHAIYYYPIISLEKNLLHIKLHVFNHDKLDQFKTTNGFRKMIAQDSTIINWDSLAISSKKETLDSATNNDWGIKNGYYSKYVNGERRKVNAVDTSHNQEYKDLQMLLRLLKEYHVNASFVISPLNIYCYTNLKELSPNMEAVQKELDKNNFKCLNLWMDDTAKYEKGVLVDIMHLSDYAWYKVDKFIVDNYHLNK